MDNPITDRREKITEFFLEKEYDKLVEIGLEIVGKASGVDCGNYVLNKFGIAGTPSTITVLRNLKKEDEGDIVYYGRSSGDKFNVLHYGIKKGKKVESKWENGPVFLHDILDVPVNYGDKVFFGKIDNDVMARLQMAMQTNRTEF